MWQKYGFYIPLVLIGVAFYPGQNSYIQGLSRYSNVLSQQLPADPPTLRHPVLSQSFPTETLSAKAVYVVHIPTGTALIDKGSSDPIYPASTQKLLTALVAIEHYHIDDIVQVHIATPEGTIMGISPGETFSVDTLFLGTLINSANDAAEALASIMGRDTFIGLMQQKAQELGMQHTTIKNPTGLDEDGQETTARDMYKAARAILQNPYLMRTVSTKEVLVSNANYSKFYTFTSTNKLLGSVIGIGGMKTGTTDKAGENLISYYVYNGEPYLILVMGSTDRLTDTTRITNWIQSQVRVETIQE